MCIVIDSCTISSVFNSKSRNHHEFEPILNWITNGEGKMVFGGTKYNKELSALGKYLRIIRELTTAGKCIILDKDQVDRVQGDLEAKYSHRDFDDPHIVAIVIVSKVRIVCTSERRAIPWLKKNELYPRTIKKPKIYTSKQNRDLLKRKHIAHICTSKLTIG